MKNYIQEGRLITLAAPSGGVTSGDGVVIGALFGVASKTAAAGEKVTIATTGVFDLPKLASAVIAAGDPVAWDDAAKQVNIPGTGRYPIGTAIEAAGNGATIVRVRLDGVATAAAA
jgi:predicted RecA/RadA family phage recombinase